MDIIIRDARILREGELASADIAVQGQTIAAIAPALAADGPELQAAGCLVISGLIETHIHLDKTCILDRCRIEERHRRGGRSGNRGRQARLHRRRRLCAGQADP